MSKTEDWLKIVGVSLVVAALLFVLIDIVSGAAGGKWQAQYAEITDKHERISTDGNGNRTHSYDLEVFVAGSIYSEISVSERDYHRIHVKDKVRVYRRIGGISGWSYGYSLDKKVDTIPAEGP
jgi:hypothetical protein